MRSKGKGTVICASVSKRRRTHERTYLGMYTRFFNHILSLPLVRNLVSPLERQRLPLWIIRMYYRIWTWHKAFQLLYRVYRFIRAHDREPATQVSAGPLYSSDYSLVIETHPSPLQLDLDCILDARLHIAQVQVRRGRQIITVLKRRARHRLRSAKPTQETPSPSLFLR